MITKRITIEPWTDVRWVWVWIRFNPPPDLQASSIPLRVIVLREIEHPASGNDSGVEGQHVHHPQGPTPRRILTVER